MHPDRQVSDAPTGSHARPDGLALRADLQVAFDEVLAQLSGAEVGRCIGLGGTAITRDRTERARAHGQPMIDQFHPWEVLAIALRADDHGVSALANTLRRLLERRTAGASASEIDALRALQRANAHRALSIGEAIDTDNHVDDHERARLIGQLESDVTTATAAIARLRQAQARPA
jgi:hypothetical protein